MPILIYLKKSTDSLDNSIQEADMALYESKKNGKNMVTVFQNKLCGNPHNFIYVELLVMLNF